VPSSPPSTGLLSISGFENVTNETITRENIDACYSKPYLILMHFVHILTQKHISTLALIPEFIPFIHLMKAFTAYLLW
jgi:hypothetical protein